jgi:hypothetical protein
MSKFSFIGDLSLSDADILYNFGIKSNAILEFGSGGSTQIFAQCLPNKLFSVETDQHWIDLTKKRIGQLKNKTAPVFCNYDRWPLDKFNLIFVDGVDYLRRDFAIKIWNQLAVDGVMIFHDTRRFQDFQNAAWVAQLYHNEIDRIDINSNDSNMTVIYKKIYTPYVDWNLTEGKPKWAYGNVPNTEDMPLWDYDQK